MAKKVIRKSQGAILPAAPKKVKAPAKKAATQPAPTLSRSGKNTVQNAAHVLCNTNIPDQVTIKGLQKMAAGGPINRQILKDAATQVANGAAGNDYLADELNAL